ncbi:RNA-directed DNA polymerase [Crateriforma spongiae]|uniref:RNA-directed DNA polymerase n=1 Tax=Crateriforma spongiae TaxID=2724528 RepID=UPI0039B0F074
MTEDENAVPTPLTELSHDEARAFLLKESSYSNFDLPTYFTFDPILKKVDLFLTGKTLRDFFSNTAKPRDLESVNHVVLNNKDGQYAWRPMQLIHPVLYVDLVHKITEESNWETIVERFEELAANSCVECASIPLRSESEKVDKAVQITNWWQEIEQRSIELALDYPFLCCTDIVDCYSQIYTHSIAWAIHTKEEAKKKANRNDHSLIGNAIDTSLQDMSFGQTNGIPQGSVLMDFIAEMVLGYADMELTQQLDEIGYAFDEFTILRYRDDYRIFTTGTENAEEILRVLTTVLSDLGLKLNSSKTTFTSDVISGSVKEDKRKQIRTRMYDRSLQKHLLIIHQHAKDFPNSGSLATALTRFYRRLNRLTELRSSANVLLSIATDIAFHNPRCYPHIAAIISKLLSFVDEDQRIEMAERIRAKIQRLPNTGYMQIWLQRATIAFKDDIEFDDPLCQLVSGHSADIWDSSWISSRELKAKIKPKKIVDAKELRDIVPVIPVDEVDLFSLLGSS